MQFTSTITVILSVVASANAGLIDYGPDPEPYVYNNAPPRADQVEGVICDVDNTSKTNNLPLASRSLKDSPHHYLNDLPGSARMSPGPGKCERVSCAYNLVVYFFNDNKHDIEVPWTDIAKYTNDVAMVCGGGEHLPKDGITLIFALQRGGRTDKSSAKTGGTSRYLNGDKC